MISQKRIISRWTTMGFNESWTTIQYHTRFNNWTLITLYRLELDSLLISFQLVARFRRFLSLAQGLFVLFQNGAHGFLCLDLDTELYFAMELRLQFSGLVRSYFRLENYFELGLTSDL